MPKKNLCLQLFIAVYEQNSRHLVLKSDNVHIEYDRKDRCQQNSCVQSLLDTKVSAMVPGD